MTLRVRCGDIAKKISPSAWAFTGVTGPRKRMARGGRIATVAMLQLLLFKGIRSIGRKGREIPDEAREGVLKAHNAVVSSP